MASETTTTYDPILKEHYTDQRVETVVYKNRPALALMPKDKAAGGRNYPLPIVVAYGQGRSADFATAQTNSGADTNEQWTLTYTQNWSVVQIDALLAAVARNSIDTFMPVLMARTNSAINNLANDLHADLFSDGFGGRGTVGSTSTTTLTLANRTDVVKFEKGMVLSASPNADGSSPRTGTNTITAVDRNAGTLTAATAWTTAISSLTAGDTLFQQGDMNTSRVKVTGLAGWLPLTAPSSTAFFGVDRTIDSQRLSGVRHTGTASSLEENLLDLSYKIGESGGLPSVALMSFPRKSALIKQLGSKVQYVERKVGDIGFKGVMVHGANTDIEVYADQCSQNDRFYELQLDQCLLVSAGMAPRIWDDDGNGWLRQAAAAGMELRTTVIGAQFGIQAPGYCGVSSLT